VEVTRNAYACMLGGPDRRTLFVLTAGSSEPETSKEQAGGRIETIIVDTPGAGLP
jgi:sugar lactone lactonase YvrE